MSSRDDLGRGGVEPSVLHVGLHGHPMCSVTFRGGPPSGVDYVYLSIDGIHVNVRLDEERLRLLD